MNLVVKLIGGAKDAQSSMAGTYILGPDKVNQRSHWLQDPGTNAIWYYKGNWNIADHRYLGNSQAWIFSPEDVAGPQEATTWKYYNRKWIRSKDIFVEGTKDRIFSQKPKYPKETNIFVFIHKKQQIPTLTLKLSAF